MASSIDTTKPAATNPTTASVRDNFTAAKNEIEALQAGTIAGLQTTALDDGTAGFHLVYHPLTSAEQSAGVTPVNYEYEPGNVLRYGDNTTPGTTDMTTAFTNAIASNNRVFAPEGNYAVTNITLIEGVTLEGEACAQANSTDGYPTLITHIAVSANDVITIDSGDTSAYIQSGAVRNISIVPNSSSRYGIWLDNPLGTKIENIQSNGAYTAAFIGIRGCLNVRLKSINYLSSSTTQTPAGILVLSYDGNLVGTTLTLDDVYIHGHASNASYGILNAIKWEPAACIDTVLRNCICESISGTVFNINKGNRVWVYNQYLENVPNTNTAAAIFEVGVTGEATPNDAYDTITALHISGGIHAGFSGSPTTSIEYINADVCEEVTVDNVNISRVATFFTGTNSTQRIRIINTQAPNLTAVFSGVSVHKVHFIGANVLGTSDWGNHANYGSLSDQSNLASNLLHNGFPFWATNLGNSGGLKIYDKTNTTWKTPTPDFSAAPTVGTWVRGDVVHHTNATQGRPMGWVCVTSGTPGTWAEGPQVSYRSGAGSPSGSVTPYMIGEEYLDTSGNAWYKSYGLTNTDWQAL